jgi:hypothetical protein
VKTAQNSQRSKASNGVLVTMEGCEIHPWPWIMQFGDGSCEASYSQVLGSVSTWRLAIITENVVSFLSPYRQKRKNNPLPLPSTSVLSLTIIWSFGAALYYSSQMSLNRLEVRNYTK